VDKTHLCNVKKCTIAASHTTLICFYWSCVSVNCLHCELTDVPVIQSDGVA